MPEETGTLLSSIDTFIENKELILKQWLSYKGPKKILSLHEIDTEYFRKKYASGVFDYFMGVISGEVEIGNCPVMKKLLEYFKKREISADELFEICSHFRRSMVDFSFDKNLNSKKLFDEISYIFDENFKGILKFYTDTIFQKLIDARQDAIVASQAKEYFLSNMSHEIRTPLNAILGFINLLLYDDMSKKHKKYLEIIHDSGKNLLALINDILDFSKLRSGEFTIESKAFFLHEELSHTLELFVGSANVKDILVSSFINPKIPRTLYGDILRIKQIVSNFLSNAIKFTPNGGVIRVKVSYDNNLLEISVSDNGIGIEKKNIENVFTSFTQVPNSNSVRMDGTGLGLSICYQLAQKMGGTVDVSSDFGKGSVFRVSLPIKANSLECQVFTDIDKMRRLKILIYTESDCLTQQHNSFIEYAKIFDMKFVISNTVENEYDIYVFVYEEVNEAFQKFILTSSKKYIALMKKEYDTYESCKHIHSICFPLFCSKIHKIFLELLYPQESHSQQSKIFQKYKGHILVAEDNEANQELIKIILNNCGLSWTLAQNGREALNFFKENNYDLVLMDEQMPIMNGNEAIGKMIEYEENRGLNHTPMVALTANVIKGAKERGLLNGFDAFLGKPIQLEELYRIFTMYLKRDERYKISSYEKPQKIFGLDSTKLCEELLLSENEVKMLLELFFKKMHKTLPELKEAIDAKEYKKVALLAHSIKGSSSNFRIEELQNLANEIELMAKKEQREYNYQKKFISIREFIDSLYNYS